MANIVPQRSQMPAESWSGQQSRQPSTRPEQAGRSPSNMICVCPHAATYSRRVSPLQPLRQASQIERDRTQESDDVPFGYPFIHGTDLDDESLPIADRGRSATERTRSVDFGRLVVAAYNTT